MIRTLHLTVGLPRSGKSTWVRESGLAPVNPDSIRLALHGQNFYAGAEPMVWAVAKLMAKALFLAGVEQVVLDATNLDRARRLEWLQLAREMDADVNYVMFRTSADECARRALADGRPDLVPVITRMAAFADWEVEEDDRPVSPASS